MAKGAPPPSAPIWVLVAGCAFGAVTIVYFMVLALLPVFGYDIPCASRFPVVVVLALCTSFATGFLGSYVTLKGQIPLPFVQGHPVQFGAAGGGAALILVLLVGYWTYVRDCDPSVAARIRNVTIESPEAGADASVLRIDFDPPLLPSAVRFQVEVSDIETFARLLRVEDIDNPSLGRCDVRVTTTKWPLWVRLTGFDRTRNRRVSSLTTEPFEVAKPSP